MSSSTKKAFSAVLPVPGRMGCGHFLREIWCLYPVATRSEDRLPPYLRHSALKGGPCPFRAAIHRGTAGQGGLAFDEGGRHFVIEAKTLEGRRGERHASYRESVHGTHCGLAKHYLAETPSYAYTRSPTRLDIPSHGL
jgi:hypothetical protein